MGIQVKSHYETKDLGLVATLLCFGINDTEMKCIDPIQGRFSFLFIRKENTMKIKNDYYKNQITVSPSDLLKNIRILKAKMENYDVSPQ